VVARALARMPALEALIEPPAGVLTALGLRLTEIDYRESWFGQLEILKAAQACPELRILKFKARDDEHLAEQKKLLFELIETKPTLKELDVRFCMLKPKEVKRLLQAIDKGGSLERLAIINNHLPRALIRQLRRLPETHPTLKQVT